MAGAALIILAVLMLGLGLSLTVGDFRRVGRYRASIAAALVCQLVLLPLVCFGIVTALQLPPVSAMGMMLIAAVPGGPTAGIYSHLFGGDVAFNLTLTAINSVLSVVTLPIVVGLSLRHFLGSRDGIGLQFGEVLKVVLIVLIPIVIGMVIRARAPGVAARSERAYRIIAGSVLAGFVVFGVVSYAGTLVDAVTTVVPAALLFGVASLGTGYLAGVLTRAGHRVSIAACMEIGFHNGAMAISIAIGVLGSLSMAVPPALYGLVILVLAGVVGFFVSRGGRRPAARERRAR
ncbi:bile acid:sodium symporter family protein [Cryptosporangium aurantiacum]|uniref:Bile acid:Na+ symporter, BASS family n=1 Tax=Cryptosporangium aurantiacum TaxID=134849 RepID=A0A1M7RAI2_9ACTN|nr:bile acid:sodium symporter [Cryptosporangium aurantiacum]SHN43172.1 bile acid:Na+ symporter, BASS family [Cryptosporangium aurantiacum]